jgi:hypothetical protein
LYEVRFFLAILKILVEIQVLAIAAVEYRNLLSGAFEDVKIMAASFCQSLLEGILCFAVYGIKGLYSTHLTSLPSKQPLLCKLAFFQRIVDMSWALKSLMS